MPGGSALPSFAGRGVAGGGGVVEGDTLAERGEIAREAEQWNSARSEPVDFRGDRRAESFIRGEREASRNGGGPALPTGAAPDGGPPRVPGTGRDGERDVPRYLPD